MVATLQILGNVSKSAEVIWILSSTRNIPDLVLCHNSLTDRNQNLSNADLKDQMQLPSSPHKGTHSDVTHTFVAASMNLTPR